VSDAEKPKDEAEDKPRRRRRRAKPAEAEAAQEAPKRRSRAAAKPKAEKAEKAKAKADKPEPKAKAKPAAKPKAEEAKPPEAKPAPRRRGAELGASAPSVRAQARYVRSSARKARLVCDHIRGKSVDEARAILQFAPRHVARDWAKLLESAVANAEHNHELVGDDLRVQEAFADEGPTLKRYRPRAMGRATQIRKRTSHLTITLTPKDG
jgi:ribosomal protein L22